MGKIQQDPLIQLPQVGGCNIQSVPKKDRNKKTKFVKEQYRSMAIPLKIAHILVNKPIPNSKTSLLRDVKPATKAVA